MWGQPPPAVRRPSRIGPQPLGRHDSPPVWPHPPLRATSPPRKCLAFPPHKSKKESDCEGGHGYAVALFSANTTMSNHEAHDDPLSGLFSSVPEFAKLAISAKSEISHLLELRISKFVLKLEQSPYVPYRRDDPLNINRNFGDALRQWLGQFPPEHRLGFLHAAMGINYITEPEFDVFAQIAQERLFDAIADDELRSRRPVPTKRQLLERLRVYPVSEFGGFDELVHSLQVSGTRDRDNRTMRTTLGDFVSEFYKNLRSLAENRNAAQFIYYDREAAEVREGISSFLNSYVVLVEDCSYSGTRIKKDTQLFLQLLRLLFSSFEEALREKGFEIPRVYLLVILGTGTAADLVADLGPLGGRTREYARCNVVFGHIFDAGVSAVTHLPENTKELASLVPGGEATVRKKFCEAIRFFHKNYGHRYWEETGSDPGTESEWGFKGDGWTIVTFANCPNNSLPALWYPHTASAFTNIKPLFSRVDSRISHVGGHSELEDSMQIAHQDAKGYLGQFLASMYRNLV